MNSSSWGSAPPLWGTTTTPIGAALPPTPPPGGGWVTPIGARAPTPPPGSDGVPAKRQRGERGGKLNTKEYKAERTAKWHNDQWQKQQEWRQWHPPPAPPPPVSGSASASPPQPPPARFPPPRPPPPPVSAVTAALLSKLQSPPAAASGSASASASEPRTPPPPAAPAAAPLEGAHKMVPTLCVLCCVFIDCDVVHAQAMHFGLTTASIFILLGPNITRTPH